MPVKGGVTVNMFRNPNYLKEVEILKWTQDLITHGVPTYDIYGAVVSREPVCEYDAQNLSWSGQAVMNSCSPELQRKLKDEIREDLQFGPIVLWYAFRSEGRGGTFSLGQKIGSRHA